MRRRDRRGFSSKQRRMQPENTMTFSRKSTSFDQRPVVRAVKYGIQEYMYSKSKIVHHVFRI